jgi:hypothetical protein
MFINPFLLGRPRPEAARAKRLICNYVTASVALAADGFGPVKLLSSPSNPSLAMIPLTSFTFKIDHNYE